MNTLRFKLLDPLGVVTFGTESVRNWEAVKVAMSRNDKYRGLMRKFTGEIEFVKEIRNRLLQIIDIYGTNAEIYLTVYVGNGNGDLSSYKVIGSGALKADTTTTGISELGIKFNFVSTGFEEKLFNRDDTEVEYTQLKSIDGETLQPFDNETRRLLLHCRPLNLKSYYSWLGNSTKSINTTNMLYCMVPLKLEYAYDEDFQQPFGTEWFKTGLSNAENFFILNSATAREVDLFIDLNFRVNFKFAFGGGEFDIRLIRRVVDENYSQVNRFVLQEYTNVDANAGTNYQFDFTYNQQIKQALGAGHSVQLFIEIDNAAPLFNGFIFSPITETGNNSIKSDFYSLYPESTCDVVLPHEAFARIIAQITGNQLGFYSTVLGRVDLGYAVDGEWAYLSLANGLMVRGFPMVGDDDEITYAKLTFEHRKLFENFMKLLNLEGTIENTPDGPRFRVEKYGTFTKGNIIADFGDSYSNVTRSIDAKALFGALMAGYKAIETEDSAGLELFATALNYSSNITGIATKLDIQSEWIAGDYIIEQLRRKPFSQFPKEDTRFDDKIVLIHAKPQPDGTLVAVKNEGYTSVTGIEEPDTVYNLQISPAQNLRRWGSVIRTCMIKGGDLRYISGTKNTSLVTVKDGIEIVEAADVDVTTLDEPLYLPELLTIEQAKLTREGWDTIEANPNDICTFANKGVTLFGCIDDVDYDIAKGSVKTTLKRINR
jgi:hypothetical protein